MPKSSEKHISTQVLMQGIDETWMIDEMYGIGITTQVKASVESLVVQSRIERTIMKDAITTRADPFLLNAPWAFILDTKESQMTSR